MTFAGFIVRSELELELKLVRQCKAYLTSRRAACSRCEKELVSQRSTLLQDSEFSEIEPPGASMEMSRPDVLEM